MSKQNTQKPVHVRVMEKIASDLFDDEERGYLWLSFVEGAQQKEAAAQPAEPLFDQEVFNDAYRMAHNDQEKLATIYEDVCGVLTPEQVEAIEKQAAADVQAHITAEDNFKKHAFLQGVYQYEGFKAAAAADQSQIAEQEKVARDQTLAENYPALAQAVGQ